MSTETLQAIRNIGVITLNVLLCAWMFGEPAYRYIRAWLYVRFFIRYEMRLCAAMSKATEEDRS